MLFITFWVAQRAMTDSQEKCVCPYVPRGDRQRLVLSFWGGVDKTGIHTKRQTAEKRLAAHYPTMR
jgi:hypothetical protein